MDCRGRGKRGGCRISYYWERKQQTIYMLFIYAKSTQEDLTPAQARMLSRLVREEFKWGRIILTDLSGV
jgi:hypothetical protein